ncbi:MAG: ATP-binding protein [Deltaproteobacteria bacterium]|nr:ATP-binding protein [Deltaproteobacteria bacterium]
MSFTIEYRVAATALSIRAISMSLKAFFSNFESVADSASMLELAIAEGMNNVFEHAYDGRTEGEMRIVVQLEGKKLSVSIFDQGEEPNPDRVSAIPFMSEFTDDLPERESLLCEGRGVYIMETLMDSLDYQRVGDENCLIMKKTF